MSESCSPDAPDWLARRLLIGQMQTVEPSPLKALRPAFEPVSAWALVDYAPDLADDTFRPICFGASSPFVWSKNLECSGSPEGAAARDSILNWADGYPRLKRVPWVLDVATFTAALAGMGKIDGTRFWMPGQQFHMVKPIRLTEPSRGEGMALCYWPTRDRREFSRTLRNALLREHRRIMAEFDSHAENGQAATHAGWTARWLAGESHSAIADSAGRISGKNDPESVVKRAVQRYRRKVGL